MVDEKKIFKDGEDLWVFYFYDDESFFVEIDWIVIDLYIISVIIKFRM